MDQGRQEEHNGNGNVDDDDIQIISIGPYPIKSLMPGSPMPTGQIAGPSVPTSPNIEDDIIDLTMEIDDVETEISSVESSMCSENESDYFEVLIEKWKTDLGEHQLYSQNADFRKFVEPFFQVLSKDAINCMKNFNRANSKLPGVDEFWAYVMSKSIPRANWVATWKVVNTDRRGWPLQHLEKAEVIVKAVNFTGIARYKIELTIVKAHDPSYEGKHKLEEIPLWQLDPIRSCDESEAENQTVESARKILDLVRRFYETVYVPPETDVEDIKAYFGGVFYERLELLFLIENPTPHSAYLTLGDRGRIISAIKHYHHLQNSLFDVNNLWLVLENDSEEEETVDLSDDICYSDSMKKYILLQMQLKRQKVELGFLMKNTLRPLVDDLAPVSRENYDYHHIVVMKEVEISDFQLIHDQLRMYCDGSPKFRVFTDLDTVLRNCSFGAKIFVTSGTYSISSLHKLAKGGSLIGIRTENLDITITTTDDTGDVWLLYNAGPNYLLTIKNINFVVNTQDQKSLRNGLFAASGRISIENANFRNVNSQSCEFIVAQKSANAEVDLKDCNFQFSDTEKENVSAS